MGYGLIGETTIETKGQNMTSVKSPPPIGSNSPSTSEAQHIEYIT